jgi:hypothetical protein
MPARSRRFRFQSVKVLSGSVDDSFRRLNHIEMLPAEEPVHKDVQAQRSLVLEGASSRPRQFRSCRLLGRLTLRMCGGGYQDSPRWPPSAPSRVRAWSLCPRPLTAFRVPRFPPLTSSHISSVSPFRRFLTTPRRGLASRALTQGVSGGGYMDFHASRRPLYPMVSVKTGAFAAVCRHVRFFRCWYEIMPFVMTIERTV